MTLYANEAEVVYETSSGELAALRVRLTPAHSARYDLVAQRKKYPPLKDAPSFYTMWAVHQALQKSADCPAELDTPDLDEFMDKIVNLNPVEPVEVEGFQQTVKHD